MKVKYLKELLMSFADESEVAVSIDVNDNTESFLTYDIGIDTTENGDLQLNIAVFTKNI